MICFHSSNQDHSISIKVYIHSCTYIFTLLHRAGFDWGQLGVVRSMGQLRRVASGEISLLMSYAA